MKYKVTGLARPYEILAILGASGSGKTTLLNALNMRNRGQLKVEGDVRVNGRLMTSMDEISAVSGYVQQNDLFIGTLRVGEHLTFQVGFKDINGLFKTKQKLFFLIYGSLKRFLSLF